MIRGAANLHALMMGKRTKLGLRLEQGLREALAWKRGELELEVRTIEPVAPRRAKDSRKSDHTRRKEHKQSFAKQLRVEATGTERVLWSLLRAKKLGSVRF
jgi:hypothetical protein